MDKTELAARVKEAAFLLDKYLFSADPVILAEFGRRLAEFADDADMIAGPELGAVALAAATAMACGKPFVIVRKSEKDYGTSKLIEGPPVEGKSVLLVEDIGTTAGAALGAAKTLTQAGATITKILFAVDRLQGAAENVKGAGFEFGALLTREDMGI